MIRLLGVLAVLIPAVVAAAPPEVTRLTSAIPFPRGLAMVDLDADGKDELYVLSRGRVRDSGGVDGTIDDQAGTLWRVDPTTGETRVFARPTDPPFKLFDPSSQPAATDRRTDRPYCTLRWHEPTRSFYICAFSGIDLPAKHKTPAQAESGSFSKNFTDAVLRFDTRTGAWSELDRHDSRSGAKYPGRDGRGWAKGPDNLIGVGNEIIVAAKDNSRLIAYDVGPLVADPRAETGKPRVVLGDIVRLRNRGGVKRHVLGHSALAFRGGWLYVAFRTSGEVIRVPAPHRSGRLSLDPDRAELLAELQPWVPAESKSANITDMDLGEDGDVYIVSAMPAQIYRFTPDPNQVRQYVTDDQPWLDLATLTGNPRMKSENILAMRDGNLLVTSGDAYAEAQGPGLGGTVWRISTP